MASMRDIKLRINSVEGTKQITKAMKLVSTAKLQSAKSAVIANKPFFEITRETIASILSTTNDKTIPILQTREVKKVAHVLITANRGLAGGFNANTCRLLQSSIEDPSKHTIIAVGKKGRDYFARRGYDINKFFGEFTEKPKYSDAVVLGDYVMEQYSKGEFDEIHLVYATFKSTISQEPTSIKLFPINVDDFTTDKNQDELENMTYEPDAETVLAQIMPKYINSIIYGALVESAASEQGARMTAMDSATNNATDMIDSLNLLYNRARQDSITQELSEIVGGASALE